MYPQVHSTEHDQERPQRDRDEDESHELWTQLCGVVQVEVEPYVPWDADTQEGVVRWQAPVLAAVKGNDRRARWAWQTKRIL